MKTLTGDGSFAFNATVDGDDLVLTNVRATCFGGSSDPQDNGDTASGISTKLFSWLAAVSLPMDGRQFVTNSKAVHAALDGSPIPKMPWGTLVQITKVNGVAPPVLYTLPVIDLGPGKRTGNAVDLSIAAARLYNPNASATNFGARVDVRIIGGARYVKAG